MLKDTGKAAVVLPTMYYLRLFGGLFENATGENDCIPYFRYQLEFSMPV
jgi:hypothetical protein